MYRERANGHNFIFHRLTGGFFIDQWGLQIEADNQVLLMYERVFKVFGFQRGIGTLIPLFLAEIVTIEKLDSLPTGPFYRQHQKAADIQRIKDKTHQEVDDYALSLFPDNQQAASLAKALALKTAHAISILFENSPNPTAQEIRDWLGQTPTQLNSLLSAT